MKKFKGIKNFFQKKNFFNIYFFTGDKACDNWFKKPRN